MSALGLVLFEAYSLWLKSISSCASCAPSMIPCLDRQKAARHGKQFSFLHCPIIFDPQLVWLLVVCWYYLSDCKSHALMLSLQRWRRPISSSTVTNLVSYLLLHLVGWLARQRRSPWWRDRPPLLGEPAVGSSQSKRDSCHGVLHQHAGHVYLHQPTFSIYLAARCSSRPRAGRGNGRDPFDHLSSVYTQ